MPDYNIKFIRVTFPVANVAHVELNRPEKLNAFTTEYV
jgi:delta(3,5)-delta(2,4)-dienoyl-CoA isomerase